MARATSSLPVPLSPSSSTGARDMATFSIMRPSCRMGEESPTKRGVMDLNLLYVHSYDKCRDPFAALGPDALGQRCGAFFARLVTNQHAPYRRIPLAQHQPRGAIVRAHLI